ncbi:MAG: hypothetical protein ACFFDN_36820, partial [Candidatus Hodarchaeota archaeon]
DFSLQYHHFSTMLLGLISNYYRNSFELDFKTLFLRSLRASMKLVLCNGDACYIGRGSHQTLGYYSLILALCIGLEYENMKNIVETLFIVWRKIKQFPLESLVLNFKKQPIIHQDPDLFREEFSGWYKYNNMLDYLTIGGTCLLAAKKILARLNKSLIVGDIYHTKKIDQVIVADQIKIIKMKHYNAVISKPTRFLSEWLPIPFIVSNHDILTPTYGGDQYSKAPSFINSIPIPLLSNRFLKYHHLSRIFYSNSRFTWKIGIFGFWARTFGFKKKRITITDNFRLSKKTKIKERFVFFNIVKNDNFYVSKGLKGIEKLKIIPSINLYEGETFFTPYGQLKSLETHWFQIKENPTFKLTLELES